MIRVFFVASLQERIYAKLGVCVYQNVKKINFFLDNFLIIVSVKRIFVRFLAFYSKKIGSGDDNIEVENEKRLRYYLGY